ncbi:hypothetical protein ACFSBZ_16895 [Amnibacterium flavum]|uniref:hypothetical protein n=1 Tax=Amnibacterium flavum TaxID=2173173 RepID=UPI001057A235|nr:hypothetical protein [Amnibacterium flavum]
MATIERRTLKKAPTMDVVEAFTKQSATPAEPIAPPTPAATPVEAAPVEAAVQEAAPSRQRVTAPKETTETAATGEGPAPIRRGPGRPRSKRRMESLATKIDIELRDQVDDYLATTGGTLVDLIDEALRDRLAKK